MNEPQRRELRLLVDEARRGELETERRGKLELRARRAVVEKEHVAGGKAILAAQRTHDPVVQRLKAIARRGDLFLISAGNGSAHILDLRSGPPRLSDASDVHALLARRPWAPFDGDAGQILAIAARLVDGAEPLRRLRPLREGFAAPPQDVPGRFRDD